MGTTPSGMKIKTMRSIIIFKYFIYLAFVVSCKAQNKKTDKSVYNPEAIKLNNIAMSLFERNRANQDSIFKTISLLEEAIQKDSSYYIAYNNLASLLSYNGKYYEAIGTLDKILKINPGLIEMKTIKGFILEKSGNISQASEIYKTS